MTPLRTARPTTLLLTFDAFNTLFHPRTPVASQYTQTAQSLGFLSPTVTPEAVRAAFRIAFKRETAQRPNYGRNSPGFGGPKQWWGNVIRSCLEDVSGGKKVPDAVVRRLLERFDGREAYTLYGDVEGFFDRVKKWKAARARQGVEGRGGEINRIIVGIVSNSDDRIAPVLTSLGLTVGSAWSDNGQLLPRRPLDTERGVENKDENDVDFIVTSYEAGEEKPHRHIFDTAKARAKEHLSAVAGEESNTNWKYVHIGDDYEQDYIGAVDAGWDSFLLLRNGLEHLPGTMNHDKLSNHNVKKLATLLDISPQLGLP